MATFMRLIPTAAVLPGVIKREKYAVPPLWPMVIYMSAASTGQYMRSLKKIKIVCSKHKSIIGAFAIIILLTACSPNPFSQPLVIHKTPAPAMAGGGTVLANFPKNFYD